MVVGMVEGCAVVNLANHAREISGDGRQKRGLVKRGFVNVQLNNLHGLL